MNISNLINEEFNEYGIVLDSWPASKNMVCEQITLESGHSIKKMCCDFPVFIDYNEGMTLLVISDNLTERIFYIDRILELKPGVTFTLVPLVRSSKITLMYNHSRKLNIVEAFSVNPLDTAFPRLGFGSILTFFCQKSDRGFYFRGETHTPYEFIYVESGKLHTIVGGHDYILEESECLFVGKNEWHIQYADSSVRFITVSFFADAVNINTLSKKQLKASDTVKSLVNRMVLEKNQQLFSTEYIESLFRIMLIELIRNLDLSHSGEKFPATLRAENNLVEQALRIIDNNIQSKISFTALANELHISVPYLYELFRTHLHMPPGKYIMKIRIEESKILLREGNLTVGEIALKVGFSNIQHFSKQFRKNCGISPTQYIKSFSRCTLCSNDDD